MIQVSLQRLQHQHRQLTASLHRFPSSASSSSAHTKLANWITGAEESFEEEEEEDGEYFEVDDGEEDEEDDEEDDNDDEDGMSADDTGGDGGDGDGATVEGDDEEGGEDEGTRTVAVTCIVNVILILYGVVYRRD